MVSPIEDGFSDNDVGDMTELYAGQLMPDFQVHTLKNTHRAFATRVIRRGGPVKPLAYASRTLEDFPIHANGPKSEAVYDLYDYVSRNRVAGLLIMKNGEIVHERYELGNAPSEHWVSMSMAKSVATTLVGCAIRDGYIQSVEEPLTAYLPELTGSAYEGVSIRQLMQMTSGVKWDDTQVNAASERRQMLALQVAQKPGEIMRLMASLPRVAEPGTRWNYSTGETHVVGALVHAATGKWLSDYLSERIWSRLGMEADAYWWLESPGGLEVAGSGLCAPLRDYARFGRFIMNGGVIDGESVLPEGWMAEAGVSRMVGGERLDYGYMWWTVPDINGSLADGAYAARGIFGQYMYLNPAQDVLIAVLSSRAKPRGAEAILDNDFFNSTVEALR
ncbi:serine hydrolase domain-containing protein, partial [Asticcacaulis sp. AC466]|uniref:serine hydrolase domain-containing protein n=1 Tax=Asticcacaulis sp. AC466 TaxID=1282362 RepID=UPI00042534C4